MNTGFQRGIDPKRALVLGRQDLIITVNTSTFSDSFMTNSAWDIRDYLLELDKNLKFNFTLKEDNWTDARRSMYFLINIARYSTEDIINRLIELKPKRNNMRMSYGAIFEFKLN